MNIKRRTSALIVAAVLALVSAVAVVLYVNGANKRAVEGQEATEVWIAKGPVARGTSLASAKELLSREVVPIRSAPKTALKELPSDKALVAMTDISAGEVILDGRFSSESLLGPELLTIPTGRMAMSVGLEDPARVGSFVRPGDYVAVFTSVKVVGSNGVHSTQVLFPRVQVLGVGTESEQGSAGEKGKLKAKVTMTLALTSDESSLLVSGLAVDAYLHFALLPAGGSAKGSNSVANLLSKAVSN